ncbi:DUF2147 domain-containing protein [Sphingomonas sp. M1-B02]|uniref:DUF2147 domain-containing protein n=1 Tax=Sphingomonas sp. M1-B02 TaxID=3114300 RepID=UPI002240B789|nr:DUF2147 domain-containing protein [Sphingomonas sp. S6-11]UZK65180.1 DUF2147 domain-containing protein [Sphingomonas sp. S6-11]
MNRSRAVLLAAIVLPMLIGAVGAPEDVWRNPGNSVHVRFEDCDDLLCGKVVWASEKAIADTRRGSGAKLIGTQIFRDMREVKPGVWKGKVYVPDIDQTFSGTVTRLDADRLVGRGCLFLGIGCKSQLWTRIPD